MAEYEIALCRYPGFPQDPAYASIPIGSRMNVVN